MSTARVLRDLPPGLIIGMVHLSALPGAPRFAGSLEAVRDNALRDAEALAAGGVDAIMIENFGDAPFHPGAVPAATIAQMTAIAAAVRSRVGAPIGINVLRNDGAGAVAVAAAVGAAMVRVNVLTGARVTDQGLIEGRAWEVMRLRAQLSPDLLVLADVDVKHSAPLAARPVEDEVADLVTRGGADAVVVSGARTGAPTDPEHVARVRDVTDAPVVVGSGATLATAHALARVADGFIVGTAFKRDGRVDVERVSALCSALRAR